MIDSIFNHLGLQKTGTVFPPITRLRATNVY